MQVDTAMILRMLNQFGRLERQATDEIGWIALKYSCGRPKAERMITYAREAISEYERETDHA